MPKNQAYNAHPRFGAVLKHLREEAGLTQDALADELGTVKSCIQHWEAGRSEPGLRKLESVADFFNVSTDYMLKGEEAMVRVQVRHIRLAAKEAAEAMLDRIQAAREEARKPPHTAVMAEDDE